MTRMRFYLFVVVRTSSRPMAVTRGGMAEFFNSPTVAHVCPVSRRWEILALSSDSHQTTQRVANSGPVLGGVGGGLTLAEGCSDQSLSHCPHRSLGPIVDAELAENVLNMLLDGLIADV